MRLWIVLGFGLIAAACSPNDAALVDECKDHPRCSNLAGNEGSEDGSGGVVSQQLMNDVLQGNLSAEALATALENGHVQVQHVEQGYSSDELLALVRQQLRPAYASTADECRVLGVGSRPCGGPERFMVYSTANTNEAVLLELVEAYNRKRAVDDAREGLVSDCSVLPEPAVVLKDGICRAARTATM